MEATTTTASLHIEEMLWRLLTNEREKAARYKTQRDKARKQLLNFHGSCAAKRLSRELIERGRDR